MGQTTILIMILTIVSKIFGFVRESVMASFIGAGELKSIYTTAMTIPYVLSGIVATGLLSSYIPVYHKAMNEDGEERAKDFTSNLINTLLIYGAVAIVLVILLARPLSKLFSPKLDGEALDLAVDFTRIMSLSILAFLSSSVLSGYLNIKGNFVDPAATGIILNIIIIISTIITGKLGNPYILIIGTLIAQILQFTRFPFASKKLGFKYKRIFNLNDIYIKYLMTMMIPIILSSTADQVSVLVDNSMASAFFGVASVSKIFYAKTMLNFITGVVTMTVATVSFPEIARLGQAGKIDQMKSSVSSAIIMTMLLVIPATFGMMALANPIIKLAFERNAFTSADTIVVAGLMFSYGPFIIFTSFIKILGNAFYSVGDAKTPVIIILIQQAINIVLNFILVKFFGINGLALATAISTAIGTIIMLIAFSKKIGSLNIKNSLISLMKITSSSLIISSISAILYNFMSIRVGLILSLLLSVSIAGMIYLLLIYLLRINEVKDLLASFKNKIREKGE
ncbi:murein biosynthesis integral membrane protein MurJ [Anaerococcus sp. NML200574]|uniref:murein biosynthesis integral membrane protein MurJ n=1 Tax=Anaerococcus sp. NML200574 TaxID=2954486 RepID=UPI002237FC14|nr:murein biosynthesis integral membrane protein MurJ [Anaerococcus sp. NML200574]MCW6677776.1 murein biosynthesis integral membrane protein MurJ [Anaerococcus sp. NML200574]